MIEVVPRRAADILPEEIVQGRYRVVRKLADGGMSTVFLAEHVLIRRRVAIKVLHPELATDAAMVARFLNEASAAGTLGHPHIVESTDMGFTSAGVPYIVFEFLDGRLLMEEIYRTGGFPVARAVRVASQIASALDAAHAARIAHLDLKSDNIFLIARDGAIDYVKVFDFGISRFMEADRETPQHGEIAGTPEFMAPEQVTSPDDVDGRADIHALGVLLYEMLAARRPYVDDDPREVMRQIVEVAPPPLGRGVPEALRRLIFERLLAKDRDARMQTMREVKIALDAIGGELRAISHTPTTPLPIVPSIVAAPPPPVVAATVAPARKRWWQIF